MNKKILYSTVLVIFALSFLATTIFVFPAKATTPPTSRLLIINNCFAAQVILLKVDTIGPVSVYPDKTGALYTHFTNSTGSYSYEFSYNQCPKAYVTPYT